VIAHELLGDILQTYQNRIQALLELHHEIINTTAIEFHPFCIVASQ